MHTNAEKDPHTLKTHFTQWQHLKPPFPLSPCPQNTFHAVATPQIPFLTAPMPSKHSSRSGNTKVQKVAGTRKCPKKEKKRRRDSNQNSQNCAIALPHHGTHGFSLFHTLQYALSATARLAPVALIVHAASSPPGMSGVRNGVRALFTSRPGVTQSGGRRRKCSQFGRLYQKRCPC